MESLSKYNEAIFESIKHTDKYGEEFWYARELQSVLEYTDWRNFNNIIDKAKTACSSSEIDTLSHFVDVNRKHRNCC